MLYHEQKRDLFSVPEEYYLAHCISADFILGRGIALEFSKRFDVKMKLKSQYSNYLVDWIASYNDVINRETQADCILIDRTLNLVTKERYHHKPTYHSITTAIYLMSCIVKENDIKKIAMPKIGCGLDGLRWEWVRDIIQHIFWDIDAEILVCYL